MKHLINNTYPDETHYTVAVLSEEEDEKIKKFLKENESQEIKQRYKCEHPESDSFWYEDDLTEEQKTQLFNDGCNITEVDL